MKLPAINLRRTYLIARRDYLGYVKTWGFWLSFHALYLWGLMQARFIQNCFITRGRDFKVPCRRDKPQGPKDKGHEK